MESLKLANGKEVALHYGLAFLDEMNASSGLVVNGQNVGAGAVNEQEKLAIGDVSALGRVLYAATAGDSPRPSLKMIQDTLEGMKSVDDLQELFDGVDEGMKNSIPLQFQIKKMEKIAKESQRKQGLKAVK